MSEGDMATRAAYPGSALKNAAPGFSAIVPRGTHADGDSAAPQAGAGSPIISMGTHDDKCECAEGANIHWDVSLHHLGAGVGTEVMASFMGGGG